MRRVRRETSSPFCRSIDDNFLCELCARSAPSASKKADLQTNSDLSIGGVLTNEFQPALPKDGLRRFVV